MASLAEMPSDELNGAASQQSIDPAHRDTIQRLLDGENQADRWLIRWSDRFSPILVKETRQALKSRQFTWTFLLLMLAIVAWTLFAIVSMMPGIYFFPAGKSLMYGYLLLLIVPTIVIVPNAAYHSMASELDHGTFDVLSISPLTPMKIVSGKLAVAMVQSLIYFSALAPCIALTYLLRGIPISTIAIALGWIALASWACSSAGLMLASINRVGVYSTVLSVLMILISLGCALWAFFGLSGADWILAVDHYDGRVFDARDDDDSGFLWLAHGPGCLGFDRCRRRELLDIDPLVCSSAEHADRSGMHHRYDGNVELQLGVAAECGPRDLSSHADLPRYPLGSTRDILRRGKWNDKPSGAAILTRHLADACALYMDQSWKRAWLHLCPLFVCRCRRHDFGQLVRTFDDDERFRSSRRIRRPAAMSSSGLSRRDATYSSPASAQPEIADDRFDLPDGDPGRRW